MQTMKALKSGKMLRGLKYEISAIFPSGNIQTKIRKEKLKEQFRRERNPLPWGSQRSKA